MHPSRRAWILLATWFLGVAASAYPQEISHIRFKLDGPNKSVRITYDLFDPGDRSHEVMVQASTDQGKTWTLFPDPPALYGDVHVVKPGKGKSITWKAGEGFRNIPPNLFQVRLLLVQILCAASSVEAARDPASETAREKGEEDREDALELERSKNLPPTLKAKDGTPRVLIPAGYFTMGQVNGRPEEAPPHRVWVDAFYLDRTLATFERYDRFCGETGRTPPTDGTFQYKNPPHWGRGPRPVLNLTSKDADAYCRWSGGRLPTEAEWEKAARGGAETDFYWGKKPSGAWDCAWFGGNSSHRTWPVGGMKPNGYGLYDMAGELWEWTADWYDPEYYPNSPGRNPTGPVEGKLRVLRGGSYANGPGDLRSARRMGWDPDKPDGAQGFAGHAYEHGCRCAYPIGP